MQLNGMGHSCQISKGVDSVRLFVVNLAVSSKSPFRPGKSVSLNLLPYTVLD